MNIPFLREVQTSEGKGTVLPSTPDPATPKNENRPVYLWDKRTVIYLPESEMVVIEDAEYSFRTSPEEVVGIAVTGLVELVTQSEIICIEEDHGISPRDILRIARQLMDILIPTVKSEPLYLIPTKAVLNETVGQ